MQFIIQNYGVLLLIVYLVDRLLESIPAVKANNVFQLLHSVVKGQVVKSHSEMEKLLPTDERK